jgi:hypothetical protein
MINFVKEFQRKKHTLGSVVLIEVQSGVAVVIPKNAPLDKVQDMALSQIDVMKKAGRM